MMAIITGQGFVAALILDDNNVVTKTAPRLNYMMGWNLERVRNRCQSNHWDIDMRLDFLQAFPGTCIICGEYSVQYFCLQHWARLPPALKKRWWSETNYSTIPPSEDLIREVKNAY